MQSNDSTPLITWYATLIDELHTNAAEPDKSYTNVVYDKVSVMEVDHVRQR
jgi:hypothetical protein